MASLNECVLIGRLTRDIELRYTAAGLACANFSVAVDRKYKDKDGNKVVDFFRCKIFREKAERISQWCVKGDLICVTGSFENSSYVDKDGNDRQSTDLNVRDFDNLSPRRPEAEQDGTEQAELPVAEPAPKPMAKPVVKPTSKPQPKQAVEPEYEEDDTDPFRDE